MYLQHLPHPKKYWIRALDERLLDFTSAQDVGEIESALIPRTTACLDSADTRWHSRWNTIAPHAKQVGIATIPDLLTTRTVVYSWTSPG
eukprot:5373203-Pyramimonas_sp.AAC.1